MQNSQARKYLNPETVALVKDFRLLARLIIDGFFLGHHRGPRHAFSLEYSKHRDYYPGDPLKLVDWKLFGKTDRFFVKQYEEETNLQAWLVMDISKSMSYTGEKTTVSKLEYSKFLAAAIAYLLLEQRDLVGMLQFDDRLRKIIRPRSSNSQLTVLLQELKNMQEGGESRFEDAARLAGTHIKKRGLIVLFSDLLVKPEQVETTLKYFLHSGNELIVFHILAYEEIAFPFRRFSQFEDMETRQKVLIQPEYLKKEYARKMEEHLQSLRKVCDKLKVHYLQLETSTPFDEALSKFMQTRARMN